MFDCGHSHSSNNRRSDQNSPHPRELSASRSTLFVEVRPLAAAPWCPRKCPSASLHEYLVSIKSPRRARKRRPQRQTPEWSETATTSWSLLSRCQVLRNPPKQPQLVFKILQFDTDFAQSWRSASSGAVSTNVCPKTLPLSVIWLALKPLRQATAREEVFQ